jgi:D-beta-D-heptose 7-phosphate kinase/D-beta-D-heptose 1-phosphate adenosyltransferase
MAAASISEKIYSLAGIIEKTIQWKKEGKKIVFTNGVFDLLHKGHIFSLTQAAKEGDVLVIGLNSDSSVKRLKGDSRPVNDQDSRALLLAALSMVDAVVIFEEDTPLKFITSILPGVLVKGVIIQVDEIAGAKEGNANAQSVSSTRSLMDFPLLRSSGLCSNNIMSFCFFPLLQRQYSKAEFQPRKQQTIPA